MSFSNELARQFRRDLLSLNLQIKDFPDDAAVWKILPGITNSAGNLALHINGNLREFVGRQLGDVPYARNRMNEFSASGTSRQEPTETLVDLAECIPAIIKKLSSTDMEREYPVVVLDTALSTGEFLIHLYGHLNWHLGQIDYLRRILGGGGSVAIPT